MLQFLNMTPFHAELLPLLDRDGHDVAVVVIKGTFSIEEKRLVPHDSQDPVVLEDLYEGVPGESALLYEADTAVFKPATDVIMLGSAQAPGGHPVRQLDVRLKARDATKTVRVFGDRRWMRRAPLFRLASSPPKPFRQMPLANSRAFGGHEPRLDGTPEARWEERNPFGRGFHVRKESATNSSLPNLENPRKPIGSWKDKPEPWTFGFVPRTAPHRRDLAGTYDDEWFESTMPALPANFDYRHFQAASSGLILEPYLSVGDEVDVTNAGPNGRLHFTIPGTLIGVGAIGRRIHQRVLAHLDTIVIRADEALVHFVWRRMISAGEQHADLGEVSVFELSDSTRPLWEALITGSA